MLLRRFGKLRLRIWSHIHDYLLSRPRELQLLLLFGLIVLVWTVILFSFFPGKKIEYLLPIYPILACISGILLNDFSKGRYCTKEQRLTFGRVVMSTSFVVAVFAFLLFFLAEFSNLLGVNYTLNELTAQIVVSLSILYFCSSWGEGKTCSSRQMILRMLFLIVMISLIQYLVVYPAKDFKESSKEICLRIQELNQEGESRVQVLTQQRLRADHQVYGSYFFHYVPDISNLNSTVIIVQEDLVSEDLLNGYQKQFSFDFKDKRYEVLNKRNNG